MIVLDQRVPPLKENKTLSFYISFNHIQYRKHSFPFGVLTQHDDGTVPIINIKEKL
jgi:hypothetical protein